MVAQIRESDLTQVAELVKIDARNRVHLPKVLVREGIRYNIFKTSTGQIILDPQIAIPESELWLFENKELLASVDRGMAETTRINRGSFAKYVKNEP